MITLYPSLLAADQLNLQTALDQLDPYADGYHIDIMDHHFVPNLAGSADMIHAVAAHTNRRLWIHLMVDSPHLWTSILNLPAQSMITFHAESTKDPLKLIHAIKRLGWNAGIALKPSTPIDLIYPLLAQLDHLLIMAVEPGFAGQKFLPTTIEKIATADNYRQAHSLALHIAVDGGITKELLPSLQQAGVDEVAIGTALFATQNPAETLEALQLSLSA